MLTKVWCCIHQNYQSIDLSLIEYIEVAETDYCANWLPNIGKYVEVTISMKSGNTLYLTMEKIKLSTLEQGKN